MTDHKILSEPRGTVQVDRTRMLDASKETRMVNTYAVCGARGCVGGLVAQQLLSAGHAVRAVTRDLAQLSHLSAQTTAGPAGGRQGPW